MASSSSISNHKIPKTLMFLLILNFLYLIQPTSAVSTSSNSNSHFSRFSRHRSSPSSKPKQGFLASVQESMNHALLARSLAFNLTLSHRTVQTHTFDPVHDCLELLDDTLDMLSRIHADNDEEDVHTWLSAALTNQDTCEQSLQEKSKSYKHGLAMDFVARNLTGLLTNSLDLFVSVKSKHRKLLSEQKYFPTFVPSSEQRRLLEAPVEELKVDVVVAADGSGTHKTIGEALLSTSLASSGGRTTIYLKAGTYHENINIPTKQKNVMLVGDGKGKTVIVGSRSNRGGWTTYKTATVAAMGEGFIARDMTFVNNAGPKSEQAVALRVGADKSVVHRCSVEGYQDSLYTHSKRQFYRETDITGTVDFIFGNSAVVFQSCNIAARKPLPGQRNFVTAQGRSNPGQNTGISIQNCRITAESMTYLGRPWKEYSRTVVMQSFIGGSIHPSGWSPWSGGFGLKSLFYGEFENSGPGSSVSGRVKWSGYHSSLTLTEAEKFTVAVFIDGNMWLPSTGVSFDSGLVK
ncbi:pectinesterase family protein [Arabidopsis lyrata subsp. lyrata]|uniref:Pectinesterase n=1 Tax=Arabidopsis lyrata subsp. lyrata TaxID=81972 RepID=D7LJX2_ARALL|nr:probable pectinesterase/pectinesterase inhibitor 16 [Arabidopsis lyrata subsp. lyrata]EFH56278.1 pectinesterase family protein [Arabidopsis lyrata subsp. lyrata]|eukprot:XP_020885826.1 probable pectinesterase/pectinesterase inhibitor 16 [Arabidopsis lyrata subsp. lyrata]